MTITTTRSIASVREAMSLEFKTTGVVWLRAASTVVYPGKDRSLIDAKVRMMIRDEAKLAKRPFIFATSEWYVATGDESAERLITVLTIPRLTKLRTVTMALFLVAVEHKENYSRFRTDDPVTRWENKTNHYFQFAGEVGHRIFEAFLDQCISDPVWRVVLGNTPHIALAPVTPEVTSLAA